MTKSKEDLQINVTVYREHAKYLKELKKLGLNMSAFVKQSIEYYIPVHMEKLEVLLRYKEAMKNYSPNMNEEK